jgi:hypothetical protein
VSLQVVVKPFPLIAAGNGYFPAQKTALCANGRYALSSTLRSSAKNSVHRYHQVGVSLFGTFVISLSLWLGKLILEICLHMHFGAYTFLEQKVSKCGHEYVFSVHCICYFVAFLNTRFGCFTSKKTSLDLLKYSAIFCGPL